MQSVQREQQEKNGEWTARGKKGKYPEGMRRRIRRSLRRIRGLQAPGIGTVEMVLLLVVIIALVVIFREQILNLINSIFGNINQSVNGLY